MPTQNGRSPAQQNQPPFSCSRSRGGSGSSWCCGAVVGFVAIRRKARCATGAAHASHHSPALSLRSDCAGSLLPAPAFLFENRYAPVHVVRVGEETSCDHQRGQQVQTIERFVECQWRRSALPGYGHCSSATPYVGVRARAVAVRRQPALGCGARGHLRVEGLVVRHRKVRVSDVFGIFRVAAVQRVVDDRRHPRYRPDRACRSRWHLGLGRIHHLQRTRAARRLRRIDRRPSGSAGPNV